MNDATEKPDAAASEREPNETEITLAASAAPEPLGPPPTRAVEWANSILGRPWHASEGSVATAQYIRTALAKLTSPASDLQAEVAQLRRERDDFHMDYRMKCDVTTKALHVQVEQLRGCLAKKLREAAALETRLVDPLTHARRILTAWWTEPGVDAMPPKFAELLADTKHICRAIIAALVPFMKVCPDCGGTGYRGCLSAIPAGASQCETCGGTGDVEEFQ